MSRPDERTAEPRVDASAVHGLAGIVYGSPALDERGGRERLGRILRGDTGAFAGLSQAGKPYTEKPVAALGHEWGLGLVKGGTEAVLVVGNRTDVAWGELLPLLAPLAHTHPYFEDGPARLVPRRAAQGAVSTATKEIADHGIGTRTVNGAVRWTDLVTKDGGEPNERAKIFPSARDIAFTAKHRLPSHTVYTPYLVVQVSDAPAGAGLVIANPGLAGRLTELDQDGFPAVARGRLTFTISEARFVTAKGHAMGRLDVLADGVPFSTLRTVLTTVSGARAGTLASVEPFPDAPTDAATMMDYLDLTAATVTAHD